MDPKEAGTPRPWTHRVRDGYTTGEITGSREIGGRREAVVTTIARNGWMAGVQSFADGELIVEAVNAYDRLRAIEEAARALKAEHDANGHREPCAICEALS